MSKAITTNDYDFKELIEGNQFYVDKTDYLHKLVITHKGCFFLSRPRRFGKSLMISTLKYIFEGRRDLFAGLKIEATDYDWQKYPVVHLNMAQIKSDNMGMLHTSLLKFLCELSTRCGVEITPTDAPGDIFRDILNGCASHSPKGKVVLLIDEYDAPMVNNIGEAHFEEIRRVMADFYAEIKHANSILRFTMITGVTRFTKVSIFSALNHLTDLTMDPDYATMLGYTQEEMGLYFGDSLEKLRGESQKPGLFLTKVKDWYNGFCFSEDADTVYNPVSVGLFLNGRGRFKNYWFSTGSPSYIFRVLKEKQLDFFDTIEHPLPETAIADFEPLKMEAAPLLLQSGYLTIKKVETMMGELCYTLGFPNLEVEFAFNHYLMQMLTERPESELDCELSQLRRSLMLCDTDRLHLLLQSHIAAIPYGHRSDLERSYQNILFSLFRLLGADIQNEVHINTGRVDCIIENFNRIYLLELKMNLPAAEAMEQIHTKAYYKPYLAKQKPVTLIGMRFDSEVRNLTEWCVEEI